MGVHIEWHDARHVSTEVYAPDPDELDDWVGREEQGDDWVLCISTDEVGAIHGTREQLLKIAWQILTDVSGGRSPLVMLNVQAEYWAEQAEKAWGDRQENDGPEDEIQDNIAETYNECASRLKFLLGPLDPRVDTESPASRQHFIDTGNYLPRKKD